MSSQPASFVLHIGMPKTATTSLQAEVYPRIAERTAYAYAGLLQPQAEVKQPKVMSHLHQFFSHGADEAELRAALDEKIADGPLIISHESVLSSTVGAPWHDRVRRVGTLMRDYSPQVYVTVRHPLEAMHSYYVEHFIDAPSGRNTDFATAFTQDPRLQLYRYATSMPLIEEAFGTRPIVETMGDVVSGNSAFLRSLVGGSDYLSSDMRQHNVKNRKGGATHFDNVTLKDRLRLMVYSTPIGDSVLLRGLISKLRAPLSLLDKVQTGRVSVPEMTADERSQYLQELLPDIAYMRDEYGVDFG